MTKELVERLEDLHGSPIANKGISRKDFSRAVDAAIAIVRDHAAGSAKGRPASFEDANLGSNPSPASDHFGGRNKIVNSHVYQDKHQRTESSPPRPVEVCPDCDIAGCRHIRERTGPFAPASSDAPVKSPPALVAAVVAEIDRLGAMTGDELMDQEDVGCLELMDMAITLRNEVRPLLQQAGDGPVFTLPTLKEIAEAPDANITIARMITEAVHQRETPYNDALHASGRAPEMFNGNRALIEAYCDGFNSAVSRLTKPKPVAGEASEVDLNKCPGCGGSADNGHDRCMPPSPYYCTKCTATSAASQGEE